MTYHHYIKLMRDASVPLDNVIHRLTDEGHALTLRRTQVTFDQANIFVTPHPDDRDVVFGVYIEEFSKAGWAYGSQTAPASEDPARPVISMSFGHPRTKTRLGERPPIRPRAIGFEIPMPDPSLPITTDLIEYYAQRAADITRGLMAQQVVDEEGKMPGTPGQGGPQFRSPDWQPTVTKVEPRPLNEIFNDEDEEDDA
ncbi:hypothetical protein HOU95_gp094 [Streptomyces phage Hiyaa]|uniref:Uncharacterized protein n=1 Tax=Streptomyces phage Hiyaa TaxID=2499072 RepID=A0A3S9U8Z0_9CAUD|nr:hypothetical protein HOU95_gp094 [Streptomyces phage Hiyaa]AZS06713.1 hypothetical protein SEA_HIYAA_74 [Streptomyces phage Hiyaa]